MGYSSRAFAGSLVVFPLWVFQDFYICLPGFLCVPRYCLPGFQGLSSRMTGISQPPEGSSCPRCLPWARCFNLQEQGQYMKKNIPKLLAATLPREVCLPSVSWDCHAGCRGGAHCEDFHVLLQLLAQGEPSLVRRSCGSSSPHIASSLELSPARSGFTSPFARWRTKVVLTCSEWTWEESFEFEKSS